MTASDLFGWCVCSILIVSLIAMISYLIGHIHGEAAQRKEEGSSTLVRVEDLPKYADGHCVRLYKNPLGD